MPWNALTFGMVDEALREGLMITRLYRPPGSEEHIDEKIFRMLFTRKERQTAVIETRTRQHRITIPVEWDRWIDKFVGRPEILTYKIA